MLDTHFHYLATRKRTKDYRVPDTLIGLDIGLGPGDMKDRLEALPRREGLYFSVGAGPWSIGPDKECPRRIIERLEEDIKRYGADAVGEAGFDNYNYQESAPWQRELFELESDLAKRFNLPLVVHTRNADSELLDSLSHIDEKTIMHCFSSPPEVLRKLLDRGAYISFAGNVTYKRNDIIRESAKIVPLDRILYETDSPYLTPEPLRGRPNIPENTKYTLTFLAELKGIDREELEAIAVRNFLSLMERISIDREL